MCFASRHSRHRYSSATGQATGGKKQTTTTPGTLGPFPIHSPSVLSQLHLAKHTPPTFFWGTGTQTDRPPFPPAKWEKRHGGGRASRPGTLVPGCSTFDATSFKTCISALRCAFPPTSRRTARPPPFLACSPTNQQSQDHPHRHHWLFFPSCPSNGSVLELRILTHSMPETTGFV